MNTRLILIVVACVACAATLAGVQMQRQQLASLRVEEKNLIEQRDSRVATPAQPTLVSTPTEPARSVSPSLELLQLRAEVTRLTNRRRELFAVTNENQKLRVQLAARQTNAARLPEGYIRKSNARMAGYSTPEATLETFLWAVQNRDFTNMLQALTPEMAQKLQEEFARSERASEDFFKGAGALPGMRIAERQPDSDPDVCRLKLEIAPGLPTESVIFRRINGEWKMQMH